ncbi:glycosyltransferase family 4 protein [Cellulomonas sp. URHB0016]
MRLAMMTPSFSDNSLGRTYCLWLLAHSLGWQTTVLSSEGSAVWGPLRGTPFAARCAVGADPEAVRALVHRSDLVVAVKPLPTSFGVAIDLCRTLDRPLLLDIDDAHLEHALSWRRPARRIGRAVLRPRRAAELVRLRRAAAGVPTTAGNPVLARRWGGDVVPHVRPDTGPGAPHRPSAPVVAFVGTDQPHKGVDLLRSAVERSQQHGYRLVVTDRPPADARPWEEWIGPTSLEDGLEVARTSDVVAAPSRDTPFSRGQVPVKLVDGMMLGRAVVASDLPGARWATDGTGILVRPGSVDALVDALAALVDPAARGALGVRARDRAVALFGVAAVAPTFERACLRAAAGVGHRGPR